MPATRTVTETVTAASPPPATDTHPPLKPRRLIVCLDGTSEAAYSYRKFEKKSLTNVSRISRLIPPQTKDGTDQIVLYLSGVGTGQGNPLRRVHQAFGKGIDDKIIEAYSFVCHNYREYPADDRADDKADSIILIGYSRGAFAARCVADMICRAGLLRKEDICYVGALYRLWREQKLNLLPLPGNSARPVKPPGRKPRLGAWTTQLSGTAWVQRCVDGIANTKRRAARVTACALWDTVSFAYTAGVWPPSKWVPRRKFPFVNSNLCDGVDNVFHALSLHEHRRAFLPVVLAEHRETTVKQCWFAGYHADIGGKGQSAGLGSFSLIWVMDQIKPFVEFNEDALWVREPAKPKSKKKLDRAPLRPRIIRAVPPVLSRPARWCLLIKWRKPLRHSKDRIRQHWEVKTGGSGPLFLETIHGSVLGLLEIKDGMKRPQQLRGAKRKLSGDWVLRDGAMLTQDAMTGHQLKLISKWLTKDLRAAQECKISSGSKTAMDPVSMCYTDLMEWVDRMSHELHLHEDEKRRGFMPERIELMSLGRRISHRLRIGNPKLEKVAMPSHDELGEVARWADTATELLRNSDGPGTVVGVVPGREKGQRFQIRVVPFYLSDEAERGLGLDEKHHDTTSMTRTIAPKVFDGGLPSWALGSSRGVVSVVC